MVAPAAEPDFDVKYRPTKLTHVLGQDAAVKTVRAFKANVPKSLLFYGSSGCGKSTLARVLTADILGQPLDSTDVQIINCPGLTNVSQKLAEVASGTRLLPMREGGRRVWLFEEVHALSGHRLNGQRSLLTTLDDAPPHNLFLFCTTEPGKLEEPLRNRCVQIEIRPMSEAGAAALARKIAAAEDIPLTDDVVDRIVALAQGAARSVCKLLQKIRHLKTEDDQFEVLGRGLEVDPEKFALTRALLFQGSAPNWADVAKALTDLEGEDPESLRCVTLAAARNLLLKKGSKRAYRAIACLEKPLYDRGSAKALLAMACFEICTPDR